MVWPYAYFLSWFFVNHNATSSISRQKDLITHGHDKPSISHSYEMLARYYSDTNDRDNEIICYSQAIQHHPNARITARLGTLYGLSNQYDSCRKYLVFSATLDSLNPQTLYNLGVLEYKAGQLDNALLWSTRYIRLIEPDAKTLTLLSNIYLALGDSSFQSNNFIRAIDCFRKSINYGGYNKINCNNIAVSFGKINSDSAIYYGRLSEKFH